MPANRTQRGAGLALIELGLVRRREKTGWLKQLSIMITLYGDLTNAKLLWISSILIMFTGRALNGLTRLGCGV